MLSRLRRRRGDEGPDQAARRLALIDDMAFEVIPLKTLDAAIDALPPRSRVSVTASPVKGQAATQRITEQLLERGHHPIPHLSARLASDRAQAAELARWTRTAGVDTVFLVGGDVADPGPYPDALSFLRDFLEADPGVAAVGVTAYPDGHPLIDGPTLHAALHAKQELLAEAGLRGYCSTQMCFDPGRISGWLAAERDRGLQLPVHLGIAGIVDRAKLLTMGARLGIGPSLRYLRKNRAAITKMMTSLSYDPNDLLMALSSRFADLGVTGLHVFTFNQVEATARWRAENLRPAASPAPD